MSEQTASPLNFPEARSDSYKEVYSNFSRVGMSPWDFSIAFGLLMDPSGGTASVIVETLVRMSPQQFKAFATSLPLILAEWEARFGEIHLAPGLQVSAEALRQSLAASGFPIPADHPQTADTKDRSSSKRRS